MHWIFQYSWWVQAALQGQWGGGIYLIWYASVDIICYTPG